MNTQTPGQPDTTPENPATFPPPGYGPPFEEQTYPLNQPTPPAKKTGRKVSLLVAMLFGVGGLAVGCIGGTGIGASTQPAAKTITAPAETKTETKTVTVQASEPAKAAAPTTQAAPPPPPKPATITDGSWLVGEDFPAGTYLSRNAGDTCYWAIYKPGTQVGSFEGIIDNHNGGGNLRVILTQGQGFEAHRCGTWEKVG